MSNPTTAWPPIRSGVIGDAWRLYKRHWAVWSLAVLVDTLILGSVLGLFSPRRNHWNNFFPIGFSSSSTIPTTALAGAIQGFLMGGMIRMAQNQIEGRRPRIEDWFDVAPMWFDLALAGIISSLATAIGFGFFVIPGFIIAGLLMLAIPLVATLHLSAVEAVKQSIEVFKGQWWSATLFHFMLGIVAFMGVFLLGFGFFITAPLYPITLALVAHQYFAPVTTAGKAETSSFGEI